MWKRDRKNRVNVVFKNKEKMRKSWNDLVNGGFKFRLIEILTKSVDDVRLALVKHLHQTLQLRHSPSVALRFSRRKSSSQLLHEQACRLRIEHLILLLRLLLTPHCNSQSERKTDGFWNSVFFFFFWLRLQTMLTNKMILAFLYPVYIHKFIYL